MDVEKRNRFHKIIQPFSKYKDTSKQVSGCDENYGSKAPGRLCAMSQT
jgi:hypothetical protein